MSPEERAQVQVIAESLGETLSETIRIALLSDDGRKLLQDIVRRRRQVADYRGVTQEQLDEMWATIVRDMNRGKPLTIAPLAMFGARGKAVYLLLRSIWGPEQPDHVASEIEKKILATLDKKLAAGLRPSAAGAVEDDADAEDAAPKERKAYTHRRHRAGGE